MHTRQVQVALHYPNLKTILMVEEQLKKADKPLSRTELKERLPKKIMHQTLNLILDYLSGKGCILDTRKGIIWTFNPSQKLEDAVKQGRAIS
ncbi:MAG: hypothetical protein V1835_03185 [Candidatus Micrarchaeota archaeon]